MNRVCLTPGCPNPATRIGRCPDHARTRNRETHRNRSFYGSVKWQRTRRRVLFEQPLCECGAIAVDVDHIVPLEQGGNPWARDNLRGMCVPCHSQKTRAEQMGVTT